MAPENFRGSDNPPIRACYVCVHGDHRIGNICRSPNVAGTAGIACQSARAFNGACGPEAVHMVFIHASLQTYAATEQRHATRNPSRIGEPVSMGQRVSSGNGEPDALCDDEGHIKRVEEIISKFHTCRANGCGYKYDLAQQYSACPACGFTGKLLPGGHRQNLRISDIRIPTFLRQAKIDGENGGGK